MNGEPSRFKQIPHRLQALTNGYCEGALAEAEVRELEQLLLQDPVSRHCFTRLMAIDAGLKWEARRGNLPVPLPAVSVSSMKRRGRSPIFRVAAIVSGLILMLGACWVFLARDAHQPEEQVAQSPPALPVVPPAEIPDTEPGSVVATLTGLRASVMIERGGMSRAATSGMEIVANDAVRVPFGGAAVMTLPNAASIQLGPRSELTFQHEGRPELLSGFAEVDATESRRHLAWSLRTSNADTEVRTSRFSVGTGPESTHVRVASGAVNVSRHSDGSTLNLLQGYCSTVAASSSFEPVLTRYGTALLIVSPQEKEGWKRFNQLVGDRLIGDRLWRSAFNVKIRTLPELSPADLVDCALIVVSIFDSGEDESRFLAAGMADLPIPIVCLEPVGFPILGMTGSEIGTDYSYLKTAATLEIIQADHPLAAGFGRSSSDLFLPQRPRSLGWASPAGDAQNIVRIRGGENRWILFAFEKGSRMHDRVAPERRVGLFLSPEEIEEGSFALKFIDAAIQWCVENSSSQL